MYRALATPVQIEMPREPRKQTDESDINGARAFRITWYLSLGTWLNALKLARCIQCFSLSTVRVSGPERIGCISAQRSKVMISSLDWVNLSIISYGTLINLFYWSYTSICGWGFCCLCYWKFFRYNNIADAILSFKHEPKRTRHLDLNRNTILGSNTSGKSL